ncbi:MAG TPA: SDR family NAD(P)-dependent oxidoreductase [Pyrinomonadaceae bacterium]|nr:SDR family NAD(P)-dependent oxidoreductase [Pyrinomonadaceae bacterium]
MNFEGKVAIVTGGGGGIGLATAKKLGAGGARVVIADLDEQKFEAAAKEVERAGSPAAFGVKCDVSVEAEVISAVGTAIERFGGLNVIVNNAGLMVFKPIVEQTGEDWLKVLNVDLLGAFFFIREAFRKMRPGGTIVNVSSVHAIETTPLVASYAAAKSALLSLTRSAALEGAPLGIRVNAVLPGAVDTPMLWQNPNIMSGVEKVDPKDVGKPEDIADAIAYLASDDAKFVQGAALRVDGGRLSRL